MVFNTKFQALALVLFGLSVYGFSGLLAENRTVEQKADRLKNILKKGKVVLGSKATQVKEKLLGKTVKAKTKDSAQPKPISTHKSIAPKPVMGKDRRSKVDFPASAES